MNQMQNKVFSQTTGKIILGCKMRYCRCCRICGAALDPGEICDCVKVIIVHK